MAVLAAIRAGAAAALLLGPAAANPNGWEHRAIPLPDLPSALKDAVSFRWTSS